MTQLGSLTCLGMVRPFFFVLCGGFELREIRLEMKRKMWWGFSRILSFSAGLLVVLCFFSTCSFGKWNVIRMTRFHAKSKSKTKIILSQRHLTESVVLVYTFKDKKTRKFMVPLG